MLWLMNLDFAGGEAADTFVLNTLYVDAESTTLFVRDDNDMLIVYKHLDRASGASDKQVVKVDWTKWLDGSTISTSTWTVNDSNLTLSDASNSSTTATTYISGGVEDCEYWLVNSVVTADAVARTESRSIRVKVVRKV